MTVYCLEMRNTQDWSDVRYREYTSSKDRAERFKLVPKIKFTDSGHGVVPSVREHKGRRELANNCLRGYVREHMDEAMNKTIELDIPATAVERIERIEQERASLVSRLRNHPTRIFEIRHLLDDAANEIERLHREHVDVLQRQNLSNRAEA